MLGLLNAPECPPEEPVFANRLTADNTIAAFDSLIRALHDATLSLRPNT